MPVDFTKLSQLMSEAQQLDQAFGNFDAGGQIISMTISGGPMMPSEPGQPFTPRMPVMVSTVGITYPPQMVDAIRTALQARKAEVLKELADMGVTLPTDTTTETRARR